MISKIKDLIIINRFKYAHKFVFIVLIPYILPIFSISQSSDMTTIHDYQVKTLYRRKISDLTNLSPFIIVCYFFIFIWILFIYFLIGICPGSHTDRC